MKFPNSDHAVNLGRLYLYPHNLTANWGTCKCSNKTANSNFNWNSPIYVSQPAHGKVNCVNLWLGWTNAAWDILSPLCLVTISDRLYKFLILQKLSQPRYDNILYNCTHFLYTTELKCICKVQKGLWNTFPRNSRGTRVPFCPFVGLGPSTPFPASECVSPLGPKGEGEQHSLACEGGGTNSDDCSESLTLCILCARNSL